MRLLKIPEQKRAFVVGRISCVYENDENETIIIIDKEEYPVNVDYNIIVKILEGINHNW